MTILSATNYLIGATPSATNAARAAEDDTTRTMSLTSSFQFSFTRAFPETPYLVGILGDNIAGMTIRVRATNPTSGGTGFIILNQTIPATNRLLAVTQSTMLSIESLEINLRRGGGMSGTSVIRQLWVGDHIELPRGASAPYTPPNLGLDETPKRNISRSEEGYYLGQQNVRAPTKLMLNYPNIASSWIESNWPAVHSRLQSGTIWIAPDGDDLSQCAYAWASPREGNPTPPKLTAPNVYSLSLDLTLHP